MKLLAIDTSSDACSVALFDGNNLLSSHQIAPQQHGQLILPAIEELLQRADLSLLELNFIVFGYGPGSFTGLRIGASAVQGLAFAANLPVVLISSLQLLAQGAAAKFSADYILVARDARMEEVYWGVYKQGETGLVAPVVEDQVSKPNSIQLFDVDKIWLGVGDAWLSYDLKSFYPKINKVMTEVYPNASDLISLGIASFKQGKEVTAEKVLPIYLRSQTLWKKL